ncbi:testis specific protein Y-linked [Hoplias malabaricus]|uniref:testis specific protein Y-linked n=1 Tax=Hoplias malabaricus TaxID=27720 RepID=UPI003463284C
MSSAASDSNETPENRKRGGSPRRESEKDCPLSKRSRTGEQEVEGPLRATHGGGANGGEPAAQREKENKEEQNVTVQLAETTSEPDGSIALARNPGASSAGVRNKDYEPRVAPEKERSDFAAFAAAEALASLTGGHDDVKEIPCSSKQALNNRKDESSQPSCSSKQRDRERERQRDINRDRARERARGRHTEAAVADSSSSLLGTADRDGGGEQEGDEEDEEDDDSLAGSSSTASSSVASENEENEDGECAIVAVRMAPEVRQSVALLAQVQMRLDALEKKGARLHQRLELKLSRQRRPHLDQRGAITHTIPGFWVTALLNHPHLSAHIDENDEDALSYMTNLEIETFKNNKLGYRICFQFRRNPFFQNKVIVKELHLGMGGSPVSFSNPILWHRGQNLTGNGEPRRTAQGVYQSFFHWFSDHSTPGRDEIAQILKDDLYRNPLRYYLTPLWEPRQNGSTPKPPDNSNGDECVIISDSDDDQEVDSQDKQEEEDDSRVAGPGDSDQEAGDSSFEEREEEELDVEEVEDSRDSAGCEDRQGDQEDKEEDIDVNEDDEEETS